MDIREAAEEFRYICDPGDLDYWLKSNIPVILILSDPETERAYWVWLQDVFPDWKPGNPTTVLFRKDQTRFDANALPCCPGSSPHHTRPHTPGRLTQMPREVPTQKISGHFADLSDQSWSVSRERITTQVRSCGELLPIEMRIDA